MEKLPLETETLIQKLDEMFPERCPKATDAERDIWIYSGKRQLVRYLLGLLKETKEQN